MHMFDAPTPVNSRGGEKVSLATNSTTTSLAESEGPGKRCSKRAGRREIKEDELQALLQARGEVEEEELQAHAGEVKEDEFQALLQERAGGRGRRARCSRHGGADPGGMNSRRGSAAPGVAPGGANSMESRQHGSWAAAAAQVVRCGGARGGI